MKQLKFALKIGYHILTIILLITYIRWAGLKGISGILIGMTATSFIVLSKNPLVTLIIEGMSDDKQEYIKEIKGETNEKEKE